MLASRLWIAACLFFMFAPATTLAQSAEIPSSEAADEAPALSWMASANETANLIVSRRLIIAADTIEKLEREARASAGEDRLKKLRYITAHHLILSAATPARAWLDDYRRAAFASGSPHHIELGALYAAYLPALDGKYVEAIAGMEPLIDRAVDPYVVAAGAQMLSYSYTDIGRPTEALKAVERGMAALQKSDLALDLRAGLHDAWRYAAIAFGDYDTAIAHQSISLQAMIESGEPVDGVTILYNLAKTSSAAGDHAAALRFADQERSLAEMSGVAIETFFAAALCAHVRAQAGDFRTAERCARAALSEEEAPAEYATQVRETHVYALARLGEAAPARAQLEMLKSEFVGRDNPNAKSIIDRLEPEVLFAEGRMTGAFAALRDYLAYETSHREQMFNAGVKELRAALENDLDAAEAKVRAKSREIELIQSRSETQLVILGFVGALVVLAFTAIVNLRNAARRLAAAREAAESANRSKSDFLATMSHELRTPLNGVLGMAQSLRDESLTPDQKDRVQTIIDSGRTLTALLNDILDLSKIEAGKLDISPIDDDLRHALKRCVQLFEPQAREKGVTLSLSVDDKTPRWMRFDPVRVRQCVNNLVSNAVKFTEKGTIDITVSADLSGGRPAVRIEVIDTGPGMDEATLARLFTPFTQADASITRRFGGTGLGLTIARRLARLMGGDVTARSEVGRGTTMTFAFIADFAAPDAKKAALTEETAARAETAAALREKTLLIVDDIQVNRQVATLFLAPFCGRILQAESGAEALALLEREAIDVVLMDVQMPIMDGFETTRRVRQLPGPAADVPIVALTAEAMEGDRERCLSAGMNDYAPKPLDVRTLLSAINRALRGRIARENSSHGAAA